MPTGAELDPGVEAAALPAIGVCWNCVVPWTTCGMPFAPVPWLAAAPTIVGCPPPCVGIGCGIVAAPITRAGLALAPLPVAALPEATPPAVAAAALFAGCAPGLEGARPLLLPMLLALLFGAALPVDAALGEALLFLPPPHAARIAAPPMLATARKRTRLPSGGCRGCWIIFFAPSPPGARCAAAMLPHGIAVGPHSGCQRSMEAPI